MRMLIVNADDFGLSAGVNEGIIQAHENGIVTSTTMMVRQGAAFQAAAYARQTKTLAVGLHIDLGEWTFRDAQWIPVYERVPPDDEHAVRQEVHEQLSLFVELVGRAPTHVDSHQHVHARGIAHQEIVRLAGQLRVPLRNHESRINYDGRFYGQTESGSELADRISVDSLRSMLRTLPEGITEFSCHPARTVDFDTMYAAERLVELQTLCDPAIRSTIDAEDIILTGFDRLAPDGGHRDR